MKFINNRLGVTLVELVIGMGLVAAIGLGVNQMLSNTSQMTAKLSADQAIEELFYKIKKLSSNVEKCNEVVSGASTSSNFSFSIGSESFGAGKKINSNLKISAMSSVLKTEEGKGHFQIIVDFERSISGKKSNVEKSFSLGVVTDGTGDLKCSGANDIAIEARSTEEFCKSLGGEFSGGECIFASGARADLKAKMAEFLCQSIGGSYDGGKCDKIEVESTLKSSNFEEDKICLSGQCRTKFDNTPCPTGYLAGLSVDGQTKSCLNLSFSATSACVPNCACASSTKSSETCDDGCGGTCQGLDCDYLDKYMAKDYFPTNEEDWAKNVQVCEYVNYTDLTSPGTCSEDGRIPMNAGICKKFQSGTCTGTNSPTVMNVVDGTACGTDKICNSGVCEDILLAGCWKETGRVSSSPDINPLGYPSSRWSCEMLDGKPQPTGNGLTSAPTDECSPNAECEYHYKYGTVTYTCTSDTASCGGSKTYQPPVSTTKCCNGSDLEYEDCSVVSAVEQTVGASCTSSHRFKKMSETFPGECESGGAPAVRVYGQACL